MSENNIKIPRAISVDQIYRTEFDVMQFEGKWKASFGMPQLGGSWIIYGNSSNGKTSLAMQLAKYTTNFSKVLYNSYEEGNSLSFQNTLKRNKMKEVGTKFNWLPGEDFEILMLRLERRNMARIILMDSIQHAFLTKLQYRKLKETFPDKLFVYISHARGKKPKGEVADFIYYDADLKIRAEGYRAFVEGRLNEDEGKYFDIWPEKSEIYWQELNTA